MLELRRLCTIRARKFGGKSEGFEPPRQHLSGSTRECLPQTLRTDRADEARALPLSYIA